LRQTKRPWWPAPAPPPSPRCASSSTTSTRAPFSCVTNIFSSPLTVLSLAASNTIALYGLFSCLAAFMIRRVYAQYKASSEEMKALNPREELGVLVCSCISSMCGFSELKSDEDDDECKEEGERSGKTVAASVEMVGYYKGDPENADAESDNAYSGWSEIDSNCSGVDNTADTPGLRAKLAKQRNYFASTNQTTDPAGIFEYVVCGITGNSNKRAVDVGFFSPPGRRTSLPDRAQHPDEEQPLLEEIARTVASLQEQVRELPSLREQNASLREEIKELRARQLDTEDVVKLVADPEALPKGRLYGRSPL